MRTRRKGRLPAEVKELAERQVVPFFVATDRERARGGIEKMCRV